MVGYLLVILVCVSIYRIIYYPDKKSSSYKLGQACGRKSHQAFDWLMKE